MSSIQSYRNFLRKWGSTKPRSTIITLIDHNPSITEWMPSPNKTSSIFWVLLHKIRLDLLNRIYERKWRYLVKSEIIRGWLFIRIFFCGRFFRFYCGGNGLIFYCGCFFGVWFGGFCSHYRCSGSVGISEIEIMILLKWKKNYFYLDIKVFKPLKNFKMANE